MMRPLVLLPVLLLASCASWHVGESAVTEGPPVDGTPKARILNPEFDEEALILRESNLYQLTDEPGAIGIRLSPLTFERAGCGMGLFFTALTLGFGPGANWAVYRFSFAEVETGTRRTVEGKVGRLYGVQEVARFKGRAGLIGGAVGDVLSSAGYKPWTPEPLPESRPESAASQPSER